MAKLLNQLVLVYEPRENQQDVDERFKAHRPDHQNLVVVVMREHVRYPYDHLGVGQGHCEVGWSSHGSESNSEGEEQEKFGEGGHDYFCDRILIFRFPFAIVMLHLRVVLIERWFFSSGLLGSLFLFLFFFICIDA